MKKNKTTESFLSRISSMSWAKAKKELRANIHMASFDKSEEARDVVETFKGEGGFKAAMAVLAAHNYIKKFGVLSATYKAIEIYRKVADIVEKVPKLKRRAQDLRQELFNMEYLVAFAGHANIGEAHEWPFQPRFANVNEMGGFANILMFLAARELSKEKTTCFMVATFAVYRFLKEGLERRRKRRAA